MAVYRISVKHGTARNQGKATKHCDYINARNEYSYKAKEIVYQRELMPEWVTSSTEFFKFSEEKESINGQTYKEFEISLINDIPIEENINLLNKFLDKELQNKYYFSVVIHNKEVNYKNNKSIRNIHAHLMFSTRELDGVKRDQNTFFKRANKKFKERGGAAKNPKWNSTNITTIYNIRKSWEEEINLFLEKYNLEKVSCESLATQRQNALLKGDTLTYNRLNRKPISCSTQILNKVKQNTPLTKKEKTIYQEYIKTIKQRNLLDEIYSLEIQKQKLLKEQEKINIADKQKANINEQKYSYSYENMKENFQNMIEVEKYLLQSNINLEKINIDKENLKELAIENLYPEYKNLINEQQFYLEKLQLDLSEDKYKEYSSKLAECEYKLNSLEIDNALVEKEMTTLKENLSFEEKNIQSDIEYLSKYKNEFYNDLNKNEKNIISNLVLEQNFYSNMDTLVSNMFELEKSKKDIEKINKQLDKENLKDIAVNIITKSESRNLVSKIKKLTNEKNKLEDTLRTTRFKNDELLQKQNKLENLNIRIQNLTNSYAKLLEKLNTPESKSRIIKISSSIEKKLITKKNSLLAQRRIAEQNIHLYKAQTFDTIKNKEQLTTLQKYYKDNAAISEKNLEKYNAILKNIGTLRNKNNLEQLAYNKITGGRFYKLLSEYNQKKSSLEKYKEDLENLSFFRMKEKKNITENIEKLNKECDNLQQEYLSVKQSIQAEKLDTVIDNIEQKYINAEKNIKEKIYDENNYKFENIMKSKFVKEIKNDLYKFTEDLFLDKVYVDPKGIGLEDEGYSSNALGIKQNKKKKISREFTL